MHPFHFLKPILEHVILIPVAHAASAEQASANSGIGGVISMLGINWKLLIAQLVNFAIVLFVLWKWVFTPLSQKLAERSARIEKSLAEADDINRMHRSAEEEKAEVIRAARQEASSIVTAAESSANKVKEEIITEAKRQSQKVLDDSKKEMKAQQEAMLQSVRAEAAVLITSATEKILGEKLDSAKDKAMIERNLAELAKETK